MMSETVQLIILVLIVGCIGGGAAVVPSIDLDLHDLVVKEYTAELSRDGFLTETFVFEVRVDDEYRMLYRNWEADVVYNDELSYPYISVISVDSPFISYVKDYDATVFPNSLSESEKSFITRKAYLNEIGMYNPNYFSKGEYTLTVTYEINPPVETDNGVYHLNLQLASDHIPYESVSIILDDPSDDIFRIHFLKLNFYLKT